MNRYIPTIAAWSMLMSTAIGQTIVDYRGLEIQSPDPTGAAGLRLQNNFKALADRIGPCNYTATTDPGVTDDSAAGYYVGSLWVNTTGPTLWGCVDDTVGAADWDQLNASGGAAAISDAAYAASWDEVTTIAPSKNALYDYLSGLSSVYQAADADLTTWAGVTSSANGRSLVSAADYAAMKTLLDLEIGTDVQAYSSTLASVASKKVDRLSQFIPYSGNPILEPEGTEAMTTFGSVWYESGTYHMYYVYWLSTANGAVGHATSPDGVTWTKDAANNPVFDRDDCAFSNSIRTATVWKEGSTWYLLYTGVRFGSSLDEVGLATSTNGVAFVQTGTEPILTYDDGTWDQYGVEITSLIKVGATYYAYYESPEVYETQRPRHIGIATSTDLTTWTKDVANNPVVGGYCPFVFFYDDDYYMICPDYSDPTVGDFAEFRLYRDSAPTFYEASRVDLGPIYGTSASGADKKDIDTPCILTDTIERNSFAASNNELWMYYASDDGTWTQSLAKARFGHFPSVSANTSRGVGVGRFNQVIVDDDSTTRTNLGLEIGVDVLAQQTIGIADNNLLEVDDADAASGQIARFTANGLEGTTELSGTTLNISSLIGNLDSGLPFDDRFYINVDRAHTTNVLRRAFYCQTRVNPAVAITAQSAGVWGKVIVQTGANTVSDIVGTVGETQHNANGTVTSAKGLVASVIETGTSGTITNGYGVYINALTGQITNAYGIYQEGTEQNRFGGELAVASNTAGITLNASGTTTIVSDTSNLTLTDPTTGAKTLAQLAADTDTLGSIGSVANGDVLIYNSGWKRLGKGDDGQVLKLATGLPAWAADTDTNTTYTGGDGLTLTETDFDLDLKTGGGLEIDTGQLTLTSTHLTGEIGITIDGAGSEIADGVKGFVRVPYACTITGVYLMADQSGSIVVDVWKDTFANYPPTVADTITASAKPTLSTAISGSDTTLTDWTTAVSAGDVIGFNVDSCTTIERLTLQITTTK